MTSSTSGSVDFEPTDDDLIEIDEESLPEELLEIDEEPDEPEAETEPDEEPAAEDEDDQDGPPDNATAARLRIAEKRLRERERDVGILESRFERLLRAMESGGTTDPDPEPEPDLPDIEVDPDAHGAARIGRLESKLEEGKKERDQERAKASQQAEFRQAQESMAAYRSSVGDAYDEGIRYLTESLYTELEQSFPERTQAEILQHIDQQSRQLILHWHRQGLNPGERFLHLAQARGFKPPAPDDGKEVAEADDDAKDEIRRTRQREQRSRSLSGSSGAPPQRRVSVKRLLAMEEDEFEKAVAEKDFRSLLAHKARS